MARLTPQQKGIPLHYQDDDEPMSGNSAALKNLSAEAKAGYDDDFVLDLEKIETVLKLGGYVLDRDKIDVKLLANPLFLKLKGISRVTNGVQAQVLDKRHADTVERRELIGILQNHRSLSEEQKKFAKPLYNPFVPKAQLEALIDWVKQWEPVQLPVSDKNYLGTTTKSRLSGSAAKIIPSADQFDPKVRNIRFEDVFTIFQGSQLEQIKLFLGRVCVGHSGTLDPITKKPLKHTYRNIMVIDGQYAGQGKSTLFGYVTDALKVAGYNVCDSVPSLSGRFNLDEPFTSDLAYRDDENTGNLTKELASPVAKVMATGGVVATEQKGKDAKPTKCTTALLINANRIEKRLLWGLDDGMRSRITLCETTPEGVLAESDLPYVKIPRMAKELGVDIETIMLWCLRLATDEFCKYINENSHKLEGRIKELEASASKSNADPLDGVLAAIVLGHLIEAPDAKLPAKINLDVLKTGLVGIMQLKQNPEYFGVAEDLLNTLTQSGKQIVIPGWHPVQGLQLIDPASLPRAYELSLTRGRMASPNQRIKEVFESLSLSDGNQCYGRSDVVLPRWSNLVSNRFTLNRLRDLAAKLQPAPKNQPIIADTDYDHDLFWGLC